MRTILALAFVALASCTTAKTSCTAPSMGALVPEHTHRTTELGTSCADACFPGVCSSAYGVSEQSAVECEIVTKRRALCICVAPPAL